MKGFLLDLNRCTGCHACRLACGIENGLEPGKSWRQIYTFNAQRIPEVSRFHLSLACQHCADPACMRACPALAYSRDWATGAVLVDADLCIGCRYCSWACPFDAPRYDSDSGTVAKCTLCRHRLEEGKAPACTSLCPTGALQFAELEGVNGTEHVDGYPQTRMRPAMRFVPLRHRRTGPEITGVTEKDPGMPARLPPAQGLSAKIAVRSEWSLVVFTLGAALLVAMAAASAAGAIFINPSGFLLTALAVITVSSMHLGRPLRGWRAILNVRHSWLSREILCFLAFTVLAALMLLIPGGRDLALPAALAGLLALLCMDQVYARVAARGGVWLHSAGALLTGLFLYGLLTHDALVAGVAGLAKLALYAFRKNWTGGRWRPVATTLRLSLGFILPLATWNAGLDWVLPAVVAAEVIDRAEFYLDLDIRTPRHQIELDLRKHL